MKVGGSAISSSHLRQARRCGARRGARQAEALQEGELAHALRAHAGVQVGDVAAHAVAHQVDAAVLREQPQQHVQVAQVVDEPVPARGPLAQAEAAPVGCDHVPVALERVDQKLERRRDVHPAVQQPQLRMSGIAPGAHVVAQAADVEDVRLAWFHRLQCFTAKDAKDAKDARSCQHRARAAQDRSASASSSARKLCPWPSKADGRCASIPCDASRACKPGAARIKSRHVLPAVHSSSPAQRVLDLRRHRAHRRRRCGARPPTACPRWRSPISPTSSGWSSSTRPRAAPASSPSSAATCGSPTSRIATSPIARCCCARTAAATSSCASCSRAPIVPTSTAAGPR